MTVSAWQSGEIKLPSTEFAGFRQALSDQDMNEKTVVFEHAQAFWKSLTAKEKADPIAYRAAFKAYEALHSHLGDTWNGRTQMVSDLPDDLQRLVGAGPIYYGTPPKPARVLKERMHFPTNRTIQFTSGNDATVTFDKATNTVHWDIPENNGAVVRAMDSALYRTFFKRMDQIRWTRGTGGVVVGNDEYNNDSEYDGGGANYVTSAFGPIGADQAPDKTGDYWMADGKFVRRQDFPSVKRRAAQLDKERKAFEAKARKAAAAKSRRATAATQEQGRLGAGNGAKSGEFLRKGQSRPEVHL